MFEFTKFESWHLKLLEPGKYYGEPIVDRETRSALYRKVEGMTLLLNGKIVGILGIVPLWDGVGELTFIPSDTLYRYPKMLIKTCRNLIDLAAWTLNLRRIQATALESEPKHGRFLEALGLTKEGVLRSYGPGGEDMGMFALVPVRID